MKFITPRSNQGKPIEVSYGSDDSGIYMYVLDQFHPKSGDSEETFYFISWDDFYALGNDRRDYDPRYDLDVPKRAWRKVKRPRKVTLVPPRLALKASARRVAFRHMSAAPSVDLDPRKVYYHGTPSSRAGKSILRSGIEPPDLSTRRGPLRPVDGKVYLTSDLSYGIIYALGGDMAGSEVRDDFWRDTGEWGYLFVVPGRALKEVQPDEDSVGEMLEQGKAPAWLEALAEEILTKRYPDEPVNTGLRHDFDFYESMDAAGRAAFFADTGESPDTFDWNEDFFVLEDWLQGKGRRYNYDHYWDIDNRNLYDLVMEGRPDAQAEAGKILLDEMDSKQELELIALGAHIAHEGKVIPAECWKIHKSKAPLLKKNGSNFFRVAERCR